MGGVHCSVSSKKPQFSLTNLPYKVIVTTYLWGENSQNLFDYDSDQLIKRDLEIDFQARIVQVGNEVLALGRTECAKQQREIVEFKCEPTCVSVLQKGGGVWQVIRPRSATELPTIERHRLVLGDIIKLGRVKLTLKEANFQRDNDDEDAGAVRESSVSQVDSSLVVDSSIQCRICLSKMATVTNPFLSPCACKETFHLISGRWVHALPALEMPQELGQSLRQSQTVGQWNQSLSLASAEMRALQERLQKSVIRHVKYFQAEFKLKNLEYHLLDVPRPKDAYLMFHISHSDKSKERGICIVEIGDKRVLKIGRTQECDIRIHDVSMSRHHASILLNGDQLLLEDNCSKFGTLVLANSKGLVLPFASKDKIALQANGTVVVLSVDRKEKNFKKYRVPSQHEVFRQIQFEDEGENNINEDPVEGSGVSGGGEEILINDPSFYKDQEAKKSANYLTGSIYNP